MRPRAEGIRAMVMAKIGGSPRFSGKSGYRGKRFVKAAVIFFHRAVAAERDPAYGQRQLRDELGGAVRRDDERTDWHAADGHGLHGARLYILGRSVASRGIRDAIACFHPKIFIRLLQHANPAETFHPISGEITGNDEAHGKPV